jgi:PPP family 3-phenylpropionic acid transporter
MSLPPLSPAQLVKPRWFELRLAMIFATVFLPLGIHLPYFPLWLEAKGFGPEEIGVILAAPMFLRVVTTPLITALADRASDRANLLVALVAASLLFSLGYFRLSGYAAILVLSLLLQVVWSAQSPLADSLALSGVRRFGSSYPGMRIWGSVAFLVANLVGGMAVGAFGEASVPAMITAGLGLCLATALMAPRLGRPRLASPLSAADLQKSSTLLNPWFLLVVGGIGILHGSHGLLYAFVSIYWKALGIGETAVGLLWAWAIVAEVGAFMTFTKIFGAAPANRVLVLAGVAAVVRWLAFPLIEPLGLGIAGFVALQTMHALSTGLILIGLQKLIAETVDEARTGAAQGVAFFAIGLSMAVVTAVCGPLYDRFGVDAFYAMALTALLGLGLILLAGRQPQSAGSGGETSEPR